MCKNQRKRLQSLAHFVALPFEWCVGFLLAIIWWGFLSSFTLTSMASATSFYPPKKIIFHNLFYLYSIYRLIFCKSVNLRSISSTFYMRIFHTKVLFYQNVTREKLREAKKSRAHKMLMKLTPSEVVLDYLFQQICNQKSKYVPTSYGAHSLYAL